MRVAPSDGVCAEQRPLGRAGAAPLSFDTPASALLPPPPPGSTAAQNNSQLGFFFFKEEDANAMIDKVKRQSATHWRRYLLPGALLPHG